MIKICFQKFYLIIRLVIYNWHYNIILILSTIIDIFRPKKKQNN